MYNIQIIIEICGYILDLNTTKSKTLTILKGYAIFKSEFLVKINFIIFLFCNLDLAHKKKTK